MRVTAQGQMACSLGSHQYSRRTRGSQLCACQLRPKGGLMNVCSILEFDQQVVDRLTPKA